MIECEVMQISREHLQYYFRRETQSVAMLAISVVLIAYFYTVQPNFLSTLNVISLLKDYSLLMIISIGGTYVILMGCLDLSVASILTLSAVVVASYASYGVMAGLGLALVVGAICGLTNGMVFSKLRIPSFLTTLGTLSIFIGIAYLLLPGQGSITIVKSDLSALMTWESGIVSVELASAIVIVTISILVSKMTRFGLHVMSIGGDELRSAFAGVNVHRVKLLSYTISGIYAAITGLLLTGAFQGASILMGSGFLFRSVTAIVIGGNPLSGGSGGPWRTVVGALFITVLANGIVMMGADPYLAQAIMGLMLIIAVILPSLIKRNTAYIRY